VQGVERVGRADQFAPAVGEQHQQVAALTPFDAARDQRLHRDFGDHEPVGQGQGDAHHRLLHQGREVLVAPDRVLVLSSQAQNGQVAEVGPDAPSGMRVAESKGQDEIEQQPVVADPVDGLKSAGLIDQLLRKATHEGVNPLALNRAAGAGSTEHFELQFGGVEQFLHLLHHHGGHALLLVLLHLAGQRQAPEQHQCHHQENRQGDHQRELAHQQPADRERARGFHARTVLKRPLRISVITSGRRWSP